jgi:hypothetical protein
MRQAGNGIFRREFLKVPVPSDAQIPDAQIPVFQFLIKPRSGSCSPPGCRNWTKQRSSSIDISFNGKSDLALVRVRNSAEGRVRGSAEGQSSNLAIDHLQFGHLYLVVVGSLDGVNHPPAILLRERNSSQVRPSHRCDYKVGREPLDKRVP